MSSVIENFENIQKAHIMELDDTLIKALSQLIEYRQKTAILIIKGQDDRRHNDYLEAYEQANKYIKQLLAI